MKNNFYLLSLSLVIIALLFTACKKELTDNTNQNDEPITDINNLQVDNNFNWKTTKNVVINIGTRTNDNQAMGMIRVNIYTEPPFDEEGQMTSARKVYSGFTNANGVLSGVVHLPTAVEKLYASTEFIGFTQMAEINVVQGVASYCFGGKIKKNVGAKSASKKVIKKDAFKGAKYSLNTMGTWDNSGVPNYLTTSDVISASLLADINASLPEYAELPVSHPQYLVQGNQANLVLKDSADIWVTFVHEGAGYYNVLGYYTYQKNNEPQSINDLTDMTVIFPNVSFSGSGGNLSSGDKVHLGKFPANTVIGYFIIANGYRSPTNINTSFPTFFSNCILNPEQGTNRQHMVMLYDNVRDLLVLGFEDINRELSNCDHDFNDAVFYVTANPISAIETDDVPEIDTPVDSDNDGVSDKFDDYPSDPVMAMNYYYPGEESYGTLAFEDLWPNRGDYDFNDLVIDYQFNQITNSENKILMVDARLVVRAIGAGYHNGFGFQMDLLHSDIQNVYGVDLTHNFINLRANNTENNQTKATIVAFDNAFYQLPPQGGTFVNTIVGNPYVVPDTQWIRIVLNTPKAIGEVGYPPYNPFLIVNKTRGKEVHLPGYPPTSLADASLFGTGDDNTNLQTGNYYKSDNNLPWAMNLPSSFVYPKEKSSITEAHLKFGSWAQSNGFSFMDWYDNKLGYRNNSHLFSH
jgi:LruC domain-containing protein